MQRHHQTPFTRAKRYLLLACIAGVFVAGIAGTVLAADPIAYVISDLRVLYVCDDIDQIDWPTIYHLNDNFGCRVDLVRIISSVNARYIKDELAKKQIVRHDLYVPVDNAPPMDSVFAPVLAERRPDVIILALSSDIPVSAAAESYLMSLEPDTASLCNVRKMYRVVTPEKASGDTPAVVITSRELARRYQDRMNLEIPLLFDGLDLGSYSPRQLTRYESVTITGGLSRPGPDLLWGLPSIRLSQAIDSLMPDGKVQEALLSRAKNAISFFGLAQNMTARPRVENVIQGYKELIQLDYQCRNQPALSAVADFEAYLSRVLNRARQVTLDEIGLDWSGDITIRESPHGPRVKFRATIGVNGPQEIELSYVKFLPYWSGAPTVLDSISRKIQPHQGYVQEYLVDIDPAYLEANQPESLLFAAEIVYSRIPLTVHSDFSIYEAPELSVAFQPDYHFVPPSARLNVDKIVSSMNLKVRIDKPRSLSGEARLDLTTPAGLFAGAYRQDIALESGLTTTVVRIPFSVSNLFEMGIHSLKASLAFEDRTVAEDTAIIRIAACEVDDRIQVGFLADSTGMLEDMLRLSGADYQALTDRSLWTSDLEAFDVIVVGSGAAAMFPSLAEVKGRLSEFIGYGGSLVIMGQPATWPRAILPVSIAPEQEYVKQGQVTNRIAGANILSAPHKISLTGLLSDLGAGSMVTSAVISPAERVLVTPSGATVLSVSRLGQGQIIYVGFPLLEAMSRLNLEAIHLFANVLNY